jgi:hypothetical protein
VKLYLIPETQTGVREMTRIDNTFIASHFSADYVEHISGGWSAIRDAVLNARKVLHDPVKFPNASFEYLEKLDLEGTCFLLGAPIQYIV